MDHPREGFYVSWASGTTDSRFSSSRPYKTLFLFQQIISCDFGGTSSASPRPPPFQVKEVSTYHHLGLSRAQAIPALGGGMCHSFEQWCLQAHFTDTLKRHPQNMAGGGGGGGL